MDKNELFEKGLQITEKLKQFYPNCRYVFDDNGCVTDVIETEPEPIPNPVPTDHERLEVLEATFAEIGSLFGGNMMVSFYILQIRMGKIGIDDVPIKWRDKVKNELEETV